MCKISASLLWLFMCGLLAACMPAGTPSRPAPTQSAGGQTTRTGEVPTDEIETQVPTESLLEGSGIEVWAFIGPTCPMEHIGTPCPPKPYQASFVVLDEKEEEVLQFETDLEGYFRLELPPGAYIIKPMVTGRYPFAKAITVVVYPDEYTPIEIHFDSGIR